MRQLRRIMALAIATVFLGQAIACGTLFYPERRGQEAGKLDTDVVLLDGVGLLFFLVPGVIAFAVDLATGAIYLPPGQRSRTSEVFGSRELERVPLAARDLDALSRQVSLETGLAIDLRAPGVEVYESGAGGNVAERLAALEARAQG